VALALGHGAFNRGEVEGIGHLKDAILVHTDNGSGRKGGKGRGTVLGNLHDDL
jgi:hypothetical protein